MIASHDRLTATRLRERLHYDPETGQFVWRNKRPDEADYKRWNKRYAGTVAGAQSGSGRRMIMLDGRLRHEHRLAWIYVYGTYPVVDIDHINGDFLDNRISNLRLADRSHNCANKGKNKNNSVGLKGASKSGNMFRAQIQKSYKKKHIGTFDCPAAAHFAYIIEADKAFGEFARAR